MKKKLPFIIIGAVLLQALLVVACVLIIRHTVGSFSNENVVKYEELTLTLPKDYVKSYVFGLDFTYTNGTFVVSGKRYTEADFMGIGTNIESKEHLAKFIMDINPSFTFSEISEKDDYVYFSYSGIVDNVSHSKMAAAFEHNGNFYCITMECYTSSEHLLEDAFFEIMDTVEFE